MCSVLSSAKDRTVSSTTDNATSAGSGCRRHAGGRFLAIRDRGHVVFLIWRDLDRHAGAALAINQALSERPLSLVEDGDAGDALGATDGLAAPDRGALGDHGGARGWNFDAGAVEQVLAHHGADQDFFWPCCRRSAR